MNYDTELEFLIDTADGQAAIHLEKVQSFKAMDVSVFIGGGWSSQAQAALRARVQTMYFDEGVVLVSQTGDYPNTRAVIWMGTEDSGRSQRMRDDGRGMQIALRGFSSLMTRARKPGIFDNWGFTDDGGFTDWGQYNGIEIRITWDDAKLSAPGIVRPGPNKTSTYFFFFYYKDQNVTCSLIN